MAYCHIGSLVSRHYIHGAIGQRPAEDVQEIQEGAVTLKEQKEEGDCSSSFSK